MISEGKGGYIGLNLYQKLIEDKLKDEKHNQPLPFPWPPKASGWNKQLQKRRIPPFLIPLNPQLNIWQAVIIKCKILENGEYVFS
jgi:late competence protein required for DNA uptake (superfamily II DNA/RNA helicase)